MKINKVKIIFIVIILICAGVFFLKIRANGTVSEVSQEIHPVIGSIKTFISTTGTVLPKNRLEIKPPVNGRIDKILVQEGDKVKSGQTLALMSSTERAALLDAARVQGNETLSYWEDVYKPITLFSPIDGEVIVATTQPGQTVTTSDAVVVLSDVLIVRAQVDETDIGKIKLNQEARISLDAYPETKIKAIVEHIYYESETVNNVTIYKVDLLPEEIAKFFRSGMNASVDFIADSKDNILVIPLDAVHKENNENYCLVKRNNGEAPAKVKVELGISDDKNIEVISGVSQEDTIIVTSKKYSLPTSKSGTNPFLPARRKR